jgi:hypothetical protein
LNIPWGKQVRKHDLLDIVVVAICAVICGADSWPEVDESCCASTSSF